MVGFIRVFGSLLGVWVVLLAGCSPGQPAGANDGRSETAVAEAQLGNAEDQYFSLRPKLHPESFTRAGDSWSVAIDGDVAVVGAPHDGDESTWTAIGAAYVFRRTGTDWHLEQKLLPSDRVLWGMFGTLVAVVSDTVYVAHGNSVCVFERDGSTWTERTRWTGDVPMYSLAATSDAVAFGWPIEEGTVTVVSRSGGTWGERQVLRSDTTSDSFGTSLAFSGETLLVGAPRRGAGAVHVFTRSGSSWSETNRLTTDSDAGFPGAGFGTAVAISADTVLVGAPGNEFSTGPGSVHIWSRTGSAWSRTQWFSNGTLRLGSELSLSGDSALVGNRQQVSVLARGTTWTEQQSFTEAGRAGISGDAIVALGTSVAPNRGFARALRRSGALWGNATTLLEKPNDLGNAFGWSVALSGRTAVATTYPRWNQPGGYHTGVFVREGTLFSLEAWLTPSAPNATHGWSASVSGDTVLVGGINEAHVFVRSGTSWAEQQRLSSSLDGGFGMAVALDGDTALVGEPLYSIPAGNAGRALVFVRSGATWSLQQTLVPVGTAAEWRVGSVVALSGDTALVSGLGTFVFTRAGTTWTEQQRLSTSSHASAVDGDTAIVGSPYESRATVYVRSGTTFVEQQVLVPQGLRPAAEFGYSVALAGDRALVGENYGTHNAVYVFARSGSAWSQTQHFDSTGQFFGRSVALSSDGAFIGAPWDGDRGSEGGSAYPLVSVPRLPSGSPCPEGADSCSSGVCANGYCCSTRCDTGCGVCNATPGTCTALSVEGTSCGAATCTGDVGSGFATGESACNGSGECGAQRETSCGLYACQSSACLTACDGDGDCARGARCTGGRCAADPGGGNGGEGGEGGDAGHAGDAGASGDAGTSGNGGNGGEAGEVSRPTGGAAGRGAGAGAGAAPTGGRDAQGGSGAGRPAEPGGAPDSSGPPTTPNESGCSCRTAQRREGGRLESLLACLAACALARRRRATSRRFTPT